MQAIWSRTAQTKSCRCKACLQSATTLARRTATAASKRRLKASDVFTACYSAMFATAALVDAKVKDNRRKQWDQAIASVKATNIARTEDSPSILENVTGKVELDDLEPHGLVDNKAFSLLNSHNQTMRPGSSVIATWNKLGVRPPLKNHETALETQLSILDSHLREATTGGEHLMLGPKRHCKVIERKPSKWTHLELMQQMISKLVTKLLLETKPISGVEAVESTNMQVKMMVDQVASLKSGRIQHPVYSPLCAKTVEEGNSLNKSITTILTSHTSNSANIDLMVAKICYNLLISTAPPSINTYNIMLVHFTRLRQHRLTQVVIDSFFEDSKFRPNSLTVAAMLSHYAALGDKSGFASIVRRMRGVDGDMRIRRRGLSTLVDPTVQMWAQKWKVNIRDGCLVAKVPRDGLIFTSLILGSLRLFRMSRAVMYFRAALREGCHITAEIFLHVARACVDERNKRVAAALLSAIISQWRQQNGSSKLHHYAGVRRVIYDLMDLSGIQRPMNVLTYQQLQYGLRDLDFHTFNAWLRSLRLEAINEKIRRSAERISSLEIILAKFSSGESTSEQMILDMLDLIERHPLGRRRREHGVLQAAAQAALGESRARLSEIKRELFALIYSSLPIDHQEIFNRKLKCLPSMGLTERLKIVEDLRRTRTESMGKSGVITEGERQLPSSVSPSKVKVDHTSSQSSSFALDDRQWSLSPGASKWLVSLEPYKLEASSLHAIPGINS